MAINTQIKQIHFEKLMLYKRKSLLAQYECKIMLPCDFV